MTRHSFITEKNGRGQVLLKTFRNREGRHYGENTREGRHGENSGGGRHYGENTREDIVEKIPGPAGIMEKIPGAAGIMEKIPGKADIMEKIPGKADIMEKIP